MYFSIGRQVNQSIGVVVHVSIREERIQLFHHKRRLSEPATNLMYVGRFVGAHKHFTAAILAH